MRAEDEAAKIDSYGDENAVRQRDADEFAAFANAVIAEGLAHMARAAAFAAGPRLGFDADHLLVACPGCGGWTGLLLVAIPDGPRCVLCMAVVGAARMAAKHARGSGS